ncbi:MAG: sulfite exporter TauE/SafE family protein [Litorivicinaceae bacterium]
MMEFLIYLPLGVVSGVIAGLFGVGGGIVIVPVLLLTFDVLGLSLDVASHVAVGTSLACVVMTALSSSYNHYKKGAMLWTWIRRLVPFLIMGGVIGGWTADQLHGETLTLMLGVFLMAMGLQLFLTAKRVVAPGDEKRPHAAVIAVSGTAIGWLSAMMGIAGGAFLVPLMTSFGEQVKRAVGTASLLGLPTATAGALTFMVTGWDAADRLPWSAGYVYLPAFLGIVATSTLAARFGVRLAHSLDQVVLKRLFATFLWLVALRLLWRILG